MKAKTKSKPFSRMGAAAKRVAIAEDILKQIRLELYSMKKGMWLEVFKPQVEIKAASTSPTQSLLLGGEVHQVVPPAKCSCCAVGAACASAIRLFNKHELSEGFGGNLELDSYTAGKEILLEYFDAKQVDLIEAAFEKRVSQQHTAASQESLEKAADFGAKNPFSDMNRAKSIFANIIKNKGTFKP